MTSDFDDIRPYHDDEIQEVLARLVEEPELLHTIIAFRFSHWANFSKPLIAWLLKIVLKSRVKKIRTIKDFQLQVEKYMQIMVEKSTDSFTISGLENLSLDKPHLFISNHRDIALDPAFVNWALHVNGYDTVRIAIGDNLLSSQWTSDVMRLNKCFIVKRSAESKREKLTNSKTLSKYIHHSIVEESTHIWIAQREGRAKDGNDITNPAILSMLLLNKPKTTPIEQYLEDLSIVPVAISYEFDPCDVAKAQELTIQEEQGEYQKDDHEDMKSIALGITGPKGKVHLHFGDVLSASEENPLDSAKAIAEEMNKQIFSGYKLMPTNLAAAQALGINIGAYCEKYSEAEIEQARISLDKRTVGLGDKVQKQVLEGYAAAVKNKLPLNN